MLQALALFDFQSPEIADFPSSANGPCSGSGNGIFETLYREAELYCVLFKVIIDSSGRHV